MKIVLKHKLFQIEEDKKKAALLARMRDVDESGDVLSATIEATELRNFLDGPPTQKPILHHKKSVRKSYF